MLEVAARDQLALGVRRPASPRRAQQLLDLVVADPVVLVVVEHRDEHVQVRQQVAQAHRRRQASTVKYGSSPHSGNCSSSGCVDRDRVAERLEQPPQELLAAAAGSTASPPRKGAASSASSGRVRARRRQRRAEHLRDRHAQERRRDVGPVVDPPPGFLGRGHGGRRRAEITQAGWMRVRGFSTGARRSLAGGVICCAGLPLGRSTIYRLEVLDLCPGRSPPGPGCPGTGRSPRPERSAGGRRVRLWRPLRTSSRASTRPKW